MRSTTQADWYAEDYSIEREPDKVYIHLNHHHEEDSWFYCLDGIGGTWHVARGTIRWKSWKRTMSMRK